MSGQKIFTSYCKQQFNSTYSGFARNIELFQDSQPYSKFDVAFELNTLNFTYLYILA